MSWARVERFVRRLAALQGGLLTFTAVNGALPKLAMPGILIQAFWEPDSHGSASASMKPGLLAGGGGDHGQGIGRAIAMIKAADCRFTTAQCKSLLTSSKVKGAADRNDQRTLDMLVFSESKRLGIVPKGRTQTPQVQDAKPVAAPQQDDGWRTQQSRRTKKQQNRPPQRDEKSEAVTSHVALLHGQLKHAGAPVPVRAKLLNSMPGVMLVDKQQDLDEVYSRVEKSACCQVVVSASRLRAPKGVKEPELPDLTIVVETVDERHEQEAHLYDLAGPSPTLGAQCSVIQLGQMNTLVIRVSLTKLLTGRGAWLNWAGTHKDVMATLKKLAPDTAGLVTDAWQPKAMANSGACMMRVQRSMVHRFLQQATAEGFSASMMREDDDTQ
eukprot:228941-Amphidinium_carterae.1